MRDSLVGRIARERRELGRNVGLNCIYFNARDVTGKAEEFRAWIITCDWDVVSVTETWLREMQVWQLNVPGYMCDMQDRDWSKRGRGVALLTEENVTAVVRDDITGTDGSSSDATMGEPQK